MLSVNFYHKNYRTQFIYCKNGRKYCVETNPFWGQYFKCIMITFPTLGRNFQDQKDIKFPPTPIRDGGVIFLTTGAANFE